MKSSTLIVTSVLAGALSVHAAPTPQPAALEPVAFIARDAAATSEDVVARSVKRSDAVLVVREEEGVEVKRGEMEKRDKLTSSGTYCSVM